MNKIVLIISSAGDQRENALDTNGLDLIIVPGLGFTKVRCL